MTELQAAMGHAVLDNIDEIKSRRKSQVENYLNQLRFDKFHTITIRENTKWNFSYFPVVFDSEELLKKALQKLAEIDVFPRRYFYPSLNKIDYVKILTIIV